MLIKSFFIKGYLRLTKLTFSSFVGLKSQTRYNNKKGNIYLKSTNRNIFCILMDDKKKVKTSCSLRVRVLDYENEFNEREDLFKRGMLLGELFGEKISDLGFTEVGIHLDSFINKGRSGVIGGLVKNKIKISFIELSKSSPHNGCRPSKARRKKVRTKVKIG